MIKRRHMYHQPSITDLNKMKEEAERRARGDSRSKPVPTTIHHHRVMELCEGQQHDEIEVA